jgi:Tol biopolymer transport system component
MIIVTPNITLPPTFTPTFTPTASETPLPSATPYPLSDFGLIYTSIDEGGTVPNLYTASGDGSDERLMTTNVRDIVFDPSGEKVAFVRETTTTTGEGDEAQQVAAVELFVAPAANLEAAVQITDFGGTISSPTWAPNGVQLAFVSDFDGDEDIWTITDDGENILILTENDSIDRDPTWSPDGNRIVYISDQDSPGLTRLFMMTPDGQNVRRLNDLSGNSYQPRWSNDGMRLVFVNDGSGDGDIYIADAEGQRSLLLTADDGGAEDRQPVFTPDDQWVSFISNRAGGIFQLYLVDLRGNVLVDLIETDGDIQDLDYEPELLLRLRNN